MNKPWLEKPRARWQHFSARGQRAWQVLSARDKRLATGMALALSSLLTWLLLMQPALDKIRYWQAETPKLRAQAEALDVLLHDVRRPAQDLELSLRQSLESAGLGGHYQLQAPEAAAPQAWRLSFTEAPADAAMGWLLTRAGQFLLEVVEVRLQRAGEPSPENTAGTLSGTVRMDQALGAKERS